MLFLRICFDFVAAGADPSQVAWVMAASPATGDDMVYLTTSINGTTEIALLQCVAPSFLSKLGPVGGEALSLSLSVPLPPTVH